MGLKNVTAIFSSHDRNTLNRVCSNLLWINNYKLTLHKGNLTAFIVKHPEAKAYFSLTDEMMKMYFPDPGRLEGVKTLEKALMKMNDVEFTYPGNTKPTIKHITVQVSLGSRIAIVGPNGAGKSTMIKILIGEYMPQKGKIWKYPAARVAYVAQHAFEHLQNHPKKTPNEYIRWRYQTFGDDREAVVRETHKLNDEEEARRKKGAVFEVLDDQERWVKVKGVVQRLSGERRKNMNSKEMEYAVVFEGAKDNHPFVMSSKLERAGSEYVKMMTLVDERIASTPLNMKPLTARNVVEQLVNVGLEKEYASHSEIGQLSGGQKVKVVFAAALWNKPHILLLDEPTNFLDREALGGLAFAVRDFPGGVVIISHNEEFTQTICTETWLMQKNPETGIATLRATGADWMTQELKKGKKGKDGKKKKEGNLFDEANAKMETMEDAMGNTIKVERGMTDEQKMKRIKEITRQLKDVAKGKEKMDEEQVWELEDELKDLKSQVA